MIEFLSDALDLFVKSFEEPVGLLGWAGQALFGGRFVIQWILSEKRGASVVPPIFWYLSVGGSVCLFSYATLKGELPFIVLQAINLGIYCRNVLIVRSDSSKGLSKRVVIPIVLVIALVMPIVLFLRLPSVPLGWLILGFCGAIVWNSRFVVQWLTAEREGKSGLPTIFWWISIVGCSLLLPYAIFRRDAVFIYGFILNPIIYARNLSLIARSRRNQPTATESHESEC